MLRLFLSALSLLVLLVLPVSGQDVTYDVLITGGQVYDGTGNPAFYADVALKDGRVAAVGRLAGASAERVIDARGLVVTPGFIDLHSHADGPRRSGLRDENPRRRAAPSLVTQGITSVVVNQDGRSTWPLTGQMEEMERLGMGPNAMLMVGHGSVRSEVMGDDVQREARADEVQQMRQMVRQAMEDGAFGLSAGLEYYPGRWATTDEVIELVEEIVPFNGVYISHQRSEGTDPMWYWPSQDDPGPPNLLQSVQETIAIGEATGATVVGSHIKVKGAHYWGSSHAVVKMIERARARGVDVWADQYPYTTTGTDGNTVLVPHWLFSEDYEAGDNHATRLQAALDNEQLRSRVLTDIRHEIQRRGGAEQVRVFEHPNDDYVGLSIAELAAQYDLSPVDMVIRLQLEGDVERRGGARLRGFSLSEYDLEVYMQQPWTITASDGGIGVVEEDDSPVHARFYGTFPRRIGHYARDRGVTSVEDAIRSSTSLPAQVLGLRDRGHVREGMHADLVVMDLHRLQDVATFEDPHQYASGVEYVFVNGTLVVEEGTLTWELPGEVLRSNEVVPALQRVE